MDTFGSLVDKLGIVNLKMWNNQELLYAVRRMTFEEFSAKYLRDEKAARELWEILQRCCDLNVQRAALVDEIDERFAAATGIPNDDGRNVQRKHKTY